MNMLAWLAANLAVVFTWLIWTLLFFGIGRLLLWLVGCRETGLSKIHVVFWIGWSASIIFLQLWHLAFPVDWRAVLVVVACGIGGVAAGGRRLVREAVEHRESWKTATLAALVIAGLWSAIAIGPPLRGDSGLYHIHAVRWNSAAPIVPGLGNLHGRLAFNNSSFLYAALLDVGPWEQRSHHISNGLFAVVTMLYLLSSLRVARDRQHPEWAYAFLKLLSFPLAVLFTYKSLSSYQPDMITFLLGVVVVLQLFKILFFPEKKLAEVRLSVLAICLLSSTALTVKLSFLPMGFTASVIALGVWWQRSRAESYRLRQRYTLVAQCCLLAVVAIVPWVARSVILSGFPAFPSPALACDVPWRIPDASREEMRVGVIGYARKNGADYRDTMDNYRWVWPALKRELRHPLEFTLPLACFVLCTSVAWRLRKTPAPTPGPPLAAWIALLPSALTIVFVALSAPSARFAGAAIWMLGLCSLVLALDRFPRNSPGFRRGVRWASSLGVAMLLIAFAKSVRYANGPVHPAGFAPMPTVELVRKTTHHGLQVCVPKDANDVPWDPPLISTVEFRAGLALRREGDMTGGFVVLPSHVGEVGGEEVRR